MPLHPVPPDDLAGMVDAWAQTVQAIVDLGSTCTDDDFARATACPGWTVKDQISHVLSLEDWIAGGDYPTTRAPHAEHVRNKIGAFTERGVHEWRSVPGPEVVTTLHELLVDRLETLRDPDLTAETVVAGPFGPTPLLEMLRQRVVDVWTHEQDIREALGRPGNLDSPPAAVFVDALYKALPRIVAKDAGIPPGQAVVIEATGPVKGRGGARVDEIDGVARGVPLFSGTASDSGDATVTTLSMATDMLCRRAAGRIAVADMRWTTTGDNDVATRVLEALPFLP